MPQRSNGLDSRPLPRRGETRRAAGGNHHAIGGAHRPACYKLVKRTPCAAESWFELGAKLTSKVPVDPST